MRLQKAVWTDCELIHTMQREAFAELLEKYQDYGVSPGSESLEKIQERFMQPRTTYYLILTDEDQIAGAVRVVNRGDGSRKRVSPIFILKQFRGMGLAQKTFAEIERLHGADHWELDTILQEKGNCCLYEKLGYVRTGEIRKINERMNIVFYQKDLPPEKKLRFNSLIPELNVTDIVRTKAFYLEVLGFRLEYERPEKRFIFVSLEGNQLMLEEENGNWRVGEMTYPFGRGINFEMTVSDAEALCRRVQAAGYPLFRPLQVSRYRQDGEDVVQREFLVQDPDGYLLRFSD